MSEVFTTDIPTRAGFYKMRCDETDGENTYITITAESNGELLVHCPDIGTCLLERYHYNLCDTEWLLIEADRRGDRRRNPMSLYSVLPLRDPMIDTIEDRTDYYGPLYLQLTLGFQIKGHTVSEVKEMIAEIKGGEE